MNAKYSLLIGLSIPFLAVLFSCQSSKQSQQHLGEVKTKNGRFVKYKKYKAKKQFALKDKSYRNTRTAEKPKKNETIISESHNQKQIDTRHSTSAMLASNGTDEYQLVLASSKTSKLKRVNMLYVFEQDQQKHTPRTESHIQSIEDSGTGKKKWEWVGLSALIAGVVGLIVTFFLTWEATILTLLFLGLAVMFTSLFSFRKFRRNPDKFKGKGFTTAALILGIGIIAGAFFGFILAFGG